MRYLVCGTVLLLLVFTGLAEDKPVPAIGPAVQKAVALLDKSATGHTSQRQCFSCHQQSMPLVAFAAAQASGMRLDPEMAQRQVDHTTAFLELNRPHFLSNKGTGGQVDTAGNILLGLAAAGYKPDANTDAVVDYLLKRQAASGAWNCSSRRPPSEASHAATTWLAATGLRNYGGTNRRTEVDSALLRAHDWLVRFQPVDTEDLVFRLRGLKVCGAKPEDIQAAAEDLIAIQREDGGWPQAWPMATDAYATATALAALQACIDMPATDKTYRHGMDFLLRSQAADGSWHVASRSDPFQKYFETGFPHGNDQWISSTATAWAIIALSSGLPK